MKLYIVFFFLLLSFFDVLFFHFFYIFLLKITKNKDKIFFFDKKYYYIFLVFLLLVFFLLYFDNSKYIFDFYSNYEQINNKLLKFHNKLLNRNWLNKGEILFDIIIDYNFLNINNFNIFFQKVNKLCNAKTFQYIYSCADSQFLHMIIHIYKILLNDRKFNFYIRNIPNFSKYYNFNTKTYFINQFYISSYLLQLIKKNIYNDDYKLKFRRNILKKYKKTILTYWFFMHSNIFFYDDYENFLVNQEINNEDKYNDYFINYNSLNNKILFKHNNKNKEKIFLTQKKYYNLCFYYCNYYLRQNNFYFNILKHDNFDILKDVLKIINKYYGIDNTIKKIKSQEDNIIAIKQQINNKQIYTADDKYINIVTKIFTSCDINDNIKTIMNCNLINVNKNFDDLQFNFSEVNKEEKYINVVKIMFLMNKLFSLLKFHFSNEIKINNVQTNNKYDCMYDYIESIMNSSYVYNIYGTNINKLPEYYNISNEYIQRINDNIKKNLSKNNNYRFCKQYNYYFVDTEFKDNLNNQESEISYQIYRFFENCIIEDDKMTFILFTSIFVFFYQFFSDLILIFVLENENLFISNAHIFFQTLLITLIDFIISIFCTLIILFLITNFNFYIIEYFLI